MGPPAPNMHYEIDQETVTWTVKTVLRLEEYDGHDDMSWVLLDAIGGGAGSRQREHMLVAVTVTTVTNIATVTFPLRFRTQPCWSWLRKCPWLPKSTKKLRRAVSACFLNGG